jgi:hypothetical protein
MGAERLQAGWIQEEAALARGVGSGARRIATLLRRGGDLLLEVLRFARVEAQFRHGDGGHVHIILRTCSVQDGSSKASLPSREVEQRYELHASVGIGEREMRPPSGGCLHLRYLPETHVATDAPSPLPVHAKATTSTPGCNHPPTMSALSSGPTAALPLSGCVGALLLHDRQCAAHCCSRGALILLTSPSATVAF